MLWQNHSKINQNLWIMNRYNKDTTEKKGESYIYYGIIQQSIKYIEQNLDQELNLDIVAQQVGFSKYHFHRIFSKYVGQSLNTYIRYRRLTSSAYLLLYSDERIIDIAIHYRFESQEAYTRAFKALYSLPPAQYRSQMKLLITKKDGVKMSIIKGWYITGTSTQKYKARFDEETYHEGKRAVAFYSEDQEEITEMDFGTLMQRFQAKQYIGKRMRFSGFIQTEKVQWCGLWMRVDDKQDNLIAFDNMAHRGITGSVPWNYYACVLDIAEEATIINIGVFLNGAGKVWLDNCKFEEVGQDIPVTEFTSEQQLPLEPQNLTFEE